MNVADNLARAARHFPERAAIVFEGQTITYADLEREVDRVSHGLAGMGVSKGARVALFLPNVPEFVVAYLAVQQVGAVAVSVNAMLTTEELGYVLEDSSSHVVFTATALQERLAPLPVERVIVVDEEAFGQLGEPAPFAAEKMNTDDPAAILYTSGTTGKQKGAVLSHGNVVSNMYAVDHCLRIDPTDRLALFLPLFHCFGQNFIMNAGLNAGATLVMYRRFDPQQVIPSLKQDGVTMFFAVPTIYIGLLNAGVPVEQLASVRYWFSAAATMPVDVAERWKATYGRPIFEGYGLTETSPFASYNHEWQHRPGSVGTPIELVEMKVVDAEDNEVAAGDWGEICIAGPNVMLGYWNRPDESAQALRGGWFHTGDIGYMDADGFVFLVDRVKDMINSAGFKIWPREVEEVLYRHPAVKECAVVGVPDPLKGEIAIAVIVLDTAKAATADELAAFCRQHLATYKVPRSFELVESLPKSATGKILKRVLRDQATAVPV